MSTAADMFKEQAKGKTTRVITALRVLGGVTNKGSYEFTDDQAAQIMATIDEKVEILRAQFKAGKKKSADEFDFDDQPDLAVDDTTKEPPPE